jgi:hypothetical protein
MGSYKTFYSEAEIDVDLGEWDDDDLIKEIKERGYEVSGGDDYEEVMDDIFELYKDWITDQGDRDNRFEKAMRKFFEKHLKKVSTK